MKPEMTVVEAVRAGRAQFAKMSHEEQTAFLVEIGILNEDRQLAEHYGGQPSKAELARREAEQLASEAKVGG